MKIDKGKLAEIIKQLANMKEPFSRSDPDFMDQCHINDELNNAISILTPLQHFTGIQHKTVDENIDEECSLENLTFWKVLKMLKDHESWELDEFGRAVHISGLNFYPAYHGICFRDEFVDKYHPNLVCWWLLGFPTWRLSLYLPKENKSCQKH